MLEDNKTKVQLIVEMKRLKAQHKQVEATLKEIADYLENLFNHANAPIIVWDKELKITRFNNAFERLTGRRAIDVLGASLDILFPDDSCEKAMEHIFRTMKGEMWETVEIPVLDIDDGVKIVLWNSATLYAADGKTVIAAIAQGQDITERKQVEEQKKKLIIELQKANDKLKRISVLDGLTKIANRRRFDEYLILEWKRLKRERKNLSLIMCDIDFFKMYNDTYGHQAGDACLKDIAQAIDKKIHRPSDLVARYGGEEFAIILSDTNVEGATLIAEGIRKAIMDLKIHHVQSKADKYVTLSLGISSIIPDKDSSPENLINLADKALYKAKKLGRNMSVTNY